MAASEERRRLRAERAVDATVFVLKNIPMVLRLGLIPALLALAISFAATMAVPVAAIGESSGVPGAVEVAAWAPSILLAVAGAIVTVGIQRFILLGERPGWVIARFGRYELAFSAALAILFAVFSTLRIVAASVIGLIAAGPEQFLLRMAVGLVFGIVVIWLCLRLSLMLPHAAVTGRIAPAVSWRAMAGNGWRGFGAWLAVGLGAGIAALIAALPGLLFTEVLFPLGQFPIEDSRDLLLRRLYETAVAVPAYGAIAAVYAAFLGYAYKDLCPEEAESFLRV